MLTFHLDENVDPGIAVGLRSRGLNCTTTPEAGLRGASDPEQLEYCLRETRVIVSHDPDMIALTAQGVEHAGVAWCASRSRTIGFIVARLVYLSRNRPPELMRNWVEFL